MFIIFSILLKSKPNHRIIRHQPRRHLSLIEGHLAKASYEYLSHRHADDPIPALCITVCAIAYYIFGSG
ncbi:MAG: hypothetical protein A2Z08_04410 [Deltaproteobacteria bacterium RBG_16_54_11]|nr:MAG: hypothetical protein A2Z08_04410 [Deltaproteobacteria bacterium RBG_16_54_11]